MASNRSLNNKTFLDTSEVQGYPRQNRNSRDWNSAKWQQQSPTRLTNNNNNDILNNNNSNFFQQQNIYSSPQNSRNNMFMNNNNNPMVNNNQQQQFLRMPVSMMETTKSSDLSWPSMDSNLNLKLNNNNNNPINTSPTHQYRNMNNNGRTSPYKNNNNYGPTSSSPTRSLNNRNNNNAYLINSNRNNNGNNNLSSSPSKLNKNNNNNLNKMIKCKEVYDENSLPIMTPMYREQAIRSRYFAEPINLNKFSITSNLNPDHNKSKPIIMTLPKHQRLSARRKYKLIVPMFSNKLNNSQLKKNDTNIEIVKKLLLNDKQKNQRKFIYPLGDKNLVISELKELDERLNNYLYQLHSNTSSTTTTTTSTTTEKKSNRNTLLYPSSSIRNNIIHPLSSSGTFMNTGTVNESFDLSFDGKAMDKSDFLRMVDSFSVAFSDEEIDDFVEPHNNNKRLNNDNHNLSPSRNGNILPAEMTSAF